VKIKIQILSDLHFEFHDDYGKEFIDSLPVAGDVLVVAGDLSTASLLGESIYRLCDKFREVVYVSGNHEFYHSSFQGTEVILRDCVSRLDNFTWLNGEKVEVEGVNFIGDTLWFEEDPQNLDLRKMLSDFCCIENFEPEVYHRYDKTYRQLSNDTKPGDVVVTHHMPSFECVDEYFQGSALNCFFATHCDEIIKKNKPALWISGHTHRPYDFKIGDTRMIANPLGYPHELVNFNDSLVVEVTVET